MKKTYNLKDVAELAGVSVGTASKVLNQIYVRPQLKLRVEMAVKELNYTPNVIARSLKVNATKTIGIMIPDISSPVISQVVKGIENSSRKIGYNSIIYQTKLSFNQEKQAIETFIQNKVEGIIFIGNTVQQKVADQFKKSKIPTVFTMTKYDDPYFSSVTMDNVSAAFTAVDYLCQKGHHNIAILAGEKNDPNAGIPRLQGYLNALRNHKLEIDHDLILYGSYGLERGYQDICKLLENKNFFSALFAVSDELAIGALKALSEHQIPVPEKVSIVGFDGIKMIKYTIPAITSIVQPFYEFGCESAKTLMQCIQENKKNIHKILPFYLEENQSVTAYQ